MSHPAAEPLFATSVDAARLKPYEISSALLEDIQNALEAGDSDTVNNLLIGVHSADKAELLNLLSEDDRVELAAMLADGFDATILPELSPDAAEDVIEGLGVDRSVEVLQQLETDDAVHIIDELSDDSREDIMQAIPAALRGELEEGLAYPEKSAGRMMTKKLVCVPEFWTVGDTIDYLRAHTDLPENFYVVYVVDARFHPIGRITLGSVLQHQRSVKINQISNTETYRVLTDTDQEEVAYLFTKYGLVEAPVTNASGRLVGTITVDDVVHVIHEEEGEDYLRAGGVSEQDLQASLIETIRLRFPWLFINLLTAVLASVVIGMYSETIEKLVALAVLMPIVASMGGNAGIQSVTVAVRALATKQLKDANAMAVIRKELLIGFFNGLLLATVMAVGAWAWYHDAQLALIFGAATIIALTMAGISGAVIPIVLSKLKIDPAVSSGIFLTTITDVVGFLSFLGLAAWWLG